MAQDVHRKLKLLQDKSDKLYTKNGAEMKENDAEQRANDLRWEQFLSQVAPKSNFQFPEDRQEAAPKVNFDTEFSANRDDNTLDALLRVETSHSNEEVVIDSNKMSNHDNATVHNTFSSPVCPFGPHDKQLDSHDYTSESIRDLEHFTTLIRSNLRTEEQTRLENYLDSNTTLGEQGYLSAMHEFVENNLNVGHNILYNRVNEVERYTCKVDQCVNKNSQLTSTGSCIENNFLDKTASGIDTMITFMHKDIYGGFPSSSVSENRSVQMYAETRTQNHLITGVSECDQTHKLVDNLCSRNDKTDQYAALLINGNETQNNSIDNQRVLTQDFDNNCHVSVQTSMNNMTPSEDNRMLVLQEDNTEKTISMCDRNFVNGIHQGALAVPCVNKQQSVDNMSSETTHLLTLGSDFSMGNNCDNISNQERVEMHIISDILKQSRNTVQMCSPKQGQPVTNSESSVLEEICKASSECRREDGTASSLEEVEWTTAADGRKFVSCPVCGRMFYKLHTLMAHHASHTGEKPFQCPVCSKRFATAGYLKTHLQIHARKRKRRKKNCISGKWFACTLCGAGFAASGQLRRHHCGAKGTTAHACPGCGRTYKGSGALSLHVRLHCTSIRANACDLCGKSYDCPQKLVKHRKRHAGTHPYSCLACGSWFKSRDGLNKHSAKHTDLRPPVPENKEL